MDAVRIRRRKIARSRMATGPGMAWKWIYDVIRPDGTDVVYGADTLATARARAKQEARLTGVAVVCEWEAGR